MISRVLRKIGRLVRQFVDRVDPPKQDENVSKMARVSSSGALPEQLVWIFGTGRSGSTWLRTMLSEQSRFVVWEEPMVGRLFGDFYATAQKGQLSSRNFIMADRTKEQWLVSVGHFIMDGVDRAHPNIQRRHFVIVKEPNGSVGAPIITAALPRTRMILLIRDPRDVVASTLDASREGSWLHQRKSSGAWKTNSVADRNPDQFVETRSNVYVRDAQGAIRAYEEHDGPKVVVKYEELLADTFGQVRRIHTELGLPFVEKDLAAIVEKHSWNNIPEDNKGDGKFFRKAKPGAWREDLTNRQVELVENATSALIEKYYPGTLTSEQVRPK